MVSGFLVYSLPACGFFTVSMGFAAACVAPESLELVA
jgi:hypothetical protein